MAIVDDEGAVELQLRCTAGDAVRWLAERRPRVIAVDCPCSPAPAGARYREEERRLARAVCGIRWTPDETALRGSSYYEWIVHGLELYGALERARAGWTVIECFPTASWTRWAGPRGTRTRARWTREALAAMALAGAPARTNQDVRDAIAAAATAQLFDEGRTESYGEIVVPRASA